MARKRLYKNGGSGTTMVRSGTMSIDPNYARRRLETTTASVDPYKGEKSKYSGERIWNVPLKDLWSTTKTRITERVKTAKQKLEESTLKSLAKKSLNPILKPTVFSKVAKKGITKLKELDAEMVEWLKKKGIYKQFMQEEDPEKQKKWQKKWDTVKKAMRTGFVEPPPEEI